MDEGDKVDLFTAQRSEFKLTTRYITPPRSPWKNISKKERDGSKLTQRCTHYTVQYGIRCPSTDQEHKKRAQKEWARTSQTQISKYPDLQIPTYICKMARKRHKIANFPPPAIRSLKPIMNCVFWVLCKWIRTQFNMAYAAKTIDPEEGKIRIRFETLSKRMSRIDVDIIHKKADSFSLQENRITPDTGDMGCFFLDEIERLKTLDTAPTFKK